MNKPPKVTGLASVTLMYAVMGKLHTLNFSSECRKQNFRAHLNNSVSLLIVKKKVSQDEDSYLRSFRYCGLYRVFTSTYRDRG
jgi:hypothetical protein